MLRGRESLDPAAIFERVAAEEGVEVDKDLKAVAVGPVCQTDKAGAFDEGDLAASSRSCGSDQFLQIRNAGAVVVPFQVGRKDC